MGSEGARGIRPGLALVVVVCLTTAAYTQLADISPNLSSFAASDPDSASGGRVNGLARAGGTTYYAASEWGGVYRTADGGRTWTHLDGHLPTATWSVQVSPADPSRLVATSFYDGRVASFSGINVSTDAGRSWVRAASATPPANFCDDPARRDEPSAFGIAFDPDRPQNVYVGTNCGVAISHDAGATWRFVDPTPGDPADDVWDVLVHHSGVIDICGDDGHRRSTDGGATWTTATGAALPSGRCSIAVSPIEGHVLFAASGRLIFETDTGGADWNTQFINRSPQGRVPFVATNPRADAAFDLWFGDVELWRAGCTSAASRAPGGAARCPQSNTWSGPFTRSAGAHDDVGDVVFAPASAGGCPVLFSSDGGVFRNTKTASPDCHTPKWQQPDVSPHGLWLFGMGGARRPGQPHDDLYLGAQDNGTFASSDDGRTWRSADCCDSFDAIGSAERVVYSTCCFRASPRNRLVVRPPDLSRGGPVATLPPGDLPPWVVPNSVERFGKTAYVAVTSSGVFITKNITAASPAWTSLGASPPPGACSVAVSGDESSPVFAVEAGSCSGGTGMVGDTLWQYTGTSSTGTWRRIPPPGNTGGFGIYTVDRTDSRRLAAAHLRPGAASMVFSTDGGVTWSANAALDSMMTGGGLFRAVTRRGAIGFLSFASYPQPSLVAFDPDDRNTVVAGAANAGVFLSRDNGAHWTAITDNSGGANAVLPRPSFAHFSRETGHAIVYIGTQGRGLWRYQYDIPTATAPAARRRPQ